MAYSKHASRAIAVFGAVVLLFGVSGCQTFAGTKLAPIEPPPPSFQPSVEHTVGDFTFSMGSGAPKSSNLDGKLLGNEIMDAWKRRGYVRAEKFVKKGTAFSGTADYHLTLSGSQHNDSSFWIELLNALTLMVFPYTVTQEYDLQYVLEDVRSGATYRANVQGSDVTQVEIFLLLTLPIASRGHDTAVQRMADHLYDQLYRQGAFQRAAEAAVEAP